MSRASEWQAFAADVYLDHRHRNWVVAEEVGDVIFVSARGIVLVHRERAEHVARALGARVGVMPLELVATPPAPAPARPPSPPALAPAAQRQPLVASTGISRHRDVLGWLGIVAGAAVFVAALALPLDDPALVVALAAGLRGGRLIISAGVRRSAPAAAR